MLGSLIKTWRVRRGLTLEALAARAEISPLLLFDLEAERVETMEDSAALQRVASCLATSAAAYAELRAANTSRRFRVYGVGLPKTGTTSLAAIFGAFRSGHEVMAHETYGFLAARAGGSATEAALRDFVRLRDIRAALELDSAGFHHAYVDLLVEELPNARFVLTLRDCFSWLDSLARYLLDAGPRGGAFVGWGREQLGLPFDLPYRDASSRERLRPLLAECLGGFLAYYREGNRNVLAAVPQARLLVVRTHEISHSLDAIARFAGVRPEELDARAAHQLRAESRASLLRGLGRDSLEALFAGPPDEIMQRYFPQLSLDDYLAGSEG